MPVRRNGQTSERTAILFALPTVPKHWKLLLQKLKKTTSTSVFGDGRISTHADPTRGPCARLHHAHACTMAPQRGRLNRFVRFWASGGASGKAKFHKMGDSLPKTPINHRAKFDAASFILGGEIRNRTNTQTTNQPNKQTNSNRYIHTLPINICV